MYVYCILLYLFSILTISFPHNFLFFCRNVKNNWLCLDEKGLRLQLIFLSNEILSSFQKIIEMVVNEAGAW